MKKVACLILLAVVAMLLPVGTETTRALDAAFGPTQNLWVDRDTLRSLPMRGAAWERLAEDARGDWGRADVADQDSQHDVLTLAGALYAVRRNDVAMRTRVVEAIESAVGTEEGGRTLALGRNLTGYVLAADLVGHDSTRFRSWLRSVRTTVLDEQTLISTHAERPNNWGTHAGAARIATALFLGDSADLTRARRVFNGFLGDRSAWTGFRFGDDEWQANPSAPVPINPAGSTKRGIVVDGALVDDIRRCDCPVQSPAPKENYQWEAMQGILTQATLLSNAGFTDVWTRSDDAILRAVRFLYERAQFPAVDDDRFVPFLIDAGLGTNYAAGTTARSGKSIGYTDFTHPTGSSSAQRSSDPSRFVALAPTRLFDTRTPQVPSGRLAAGETLDVVVTGRAGVADSVGVSAVVLNVTMTNTASAGYVTAWATGDRRPPTSNLNANGPGETVANLVVVPVGKNDSISFYAQTSLDLVADVSGYFVESGSTRSGRLVETEPVRAFDTRERPVPYGVVAGGESITVRLAGSHGIPTSGASAVALHVTGVSLGGAGFVTVSPSGSPRPVTSSLNLNGSGDVRSNLVLVPLGRDGSVDIYTHAAAHLVGDVVGYFTDESADRLTDGMFVSTHGARQVDTRLDLPSGASWFAPTTSQHFPIRGGNLPASNVGAIFGNLTTTEAAGPGYVTVWATGGTRPATSSVNATHPGETRSNAAVVSLGSDSAISAYSHGGTHLVVDTFGYFIDD